MARIETSKFYNAGNKISNRFSYTNADESHQVSNCVSYWVMDAPAGGFFQVPREMLTQNGRQYIGIGKEVLEMYGVLGVVQVDKDLSDEEAAGEPYIANSEESAKAKGDALWRVYLHSKIVDFEQLNDTRLAAGWKILRPTNFIAFAYKTLGMMPPAMSEAQASVHAQPVAPITPDPAIEDLKQKNAELSRKLDAILAGLSAPKPVEPTPATEDIEAGKSSPRMTFSADGDTETEHMSDLPRTTFPRKHGPAIRKITHA